MNINKLRFKILVTLILIIMSFPIFGQVNTYDWSKVHSTYIEQADSIKDVFGEQSNEYCDALYNIIFAYVRYGAKYNDALNTVLKLNGITSQMYGEYSKEHSNSLGTTCQIYNFLERYDKTIQISKDFIFWAPKDSVTSLLFWEYANALGKRKNNFYNALAVSRDAIQRLHSLNDSILFTTKISQLYLEYDNNADVAKRKLENISKDVDSGSDYAKFEYYHTLGTIYSDIDEERSYLYLCKADSFANDPHDRISILLDQAKVAPTHLTSEKCLLNALALQAYYLGTNDAFSANIYTNLGQMYEKLGKGLHSMYAFTKALEITNNNSSLMYGRTAVNVWGKFAHYLRSNNTLLHLDKESGTLPSKEAIKLAKQYDEFASAVSMYAYGPSHPISELQDIRLAEDYLLMNLPDSALFRLPTRFSDDKPSEYMFCYESYVRGACAFKKQDYRSCDSLLMLSILHGNEKIKESYKILIDSKYKQGRNSEAYDYSRKYNDFVADEYLRKLLTLTEEERNNFILLLGNEANSLYPYICDKKSIEQSLRLSLFCKGLLFSTSAAIRKIVFKNPNSYKLFKVLQRKKQELYDLQLSDTNIDSKLRHTIDSLELTLSKEFIRMESIRQELDVPISKLQSSLTNDELAIDFEQIDDGTLIAYLLNRKGISQEKITIPHTTTNSVICSHIYDKLKSYIGKYKRVYFSPVGQLNLINIEAYLRNEMDNIEFRRISHLYRILSHQECKINEILAIGNPRFNDELVKSSERGRTFGPLPGTKIEVETISQAMGRKDILTHLYTEENANERNFKKYNDTPVNILHIATHGYYLSEKNETALLLTGANRGLNEQKISTEYEDGLLTTSEIERMSFPMLQLVVLSACDTGLGETNIDGVWGLQRAFRIAGAQNMIVSLKKVDDEGTLNFMIDFYKKLSKTRNIYKSFVYAQDNADEDTRNSFILIE